MGNLIRLAKKRLSRCERCLVRQAVLHNRGGRIDRDDRRAERAGDEFLAHLRQTTRLLSRAGLVLPDRELGRLLRLHAGVSRAVEHLAVVEAAERVILEELNTHGGDGVVS